MKKIAATGFVAWFVAAHLHINLDKIDVSKPIESAQNIIDTADTTDLKKFGTDIVTFVADRLVKPFLSGG